MEMTQLRLNCLGTVIVPPLHHGQSDYITLAVVNISHDLKCK